QYRLLPLLTAAIGRFCCESRSGGTVIPLLSCDSLWRRAMMGRLNHDQEQLLYSFHLDEAVPHDHPVRKIAAVLDLSWVHSDLAPFYPKMGRASIDPELMIRMLIIGYVFAIRSERAICRDVQVNLPPAWPGRSRPGARLRSVVLHRNERWSVEVHGQDF